MTEILLYAKNLTSAGKVPMMKQNVFSWVADENMEALEGENLAVVKYSASDYPSLFELFTPVLKVVAPFSTERIKQNK